MVKIPVLLRITPTGIGAGYYFDMLIETKKQELNYQGSALVESYKTLQTALPQIEPKPLLVNVHRKLFRYRVCRMF